MKTYLAKTGEIKQRCVIFDAEGGALGRLAVRIADTLRGKDLPTYTPHTDTGAFVVVVNAVKVLLTGKKAETKMSWSYSGYRSGRKEESLGSLRSRKPERLIKEAVWGMLPHGRLGRAHFKNLRVYPGVEHPHSAQKPEKAVF